MRDAVNGGILDIVRREEVVLRGDMVGVEPPFPARFVCEQLPLAFLYRLRFGAGDPVAYNRRGQTACHKYADNGGEDVPKPDTYGEKKHARRA